jgi:hypothetical protein
LNASKRGSSHGYHNVVDHGCKVHLGGIVHRVGVDLVRSSEVGSTNVKPYSACIICSMHDILDIMMKARRNVQRASGSQSRGRLYCTRTV